MGSSDGSAAGALRTARRSAQAAQAHAQAMEQRALAASAAEEEAAAARSQVEWLKHQLQVPRGQGWGLMSLGPFCLSELYSPRYINSLWISGYNAFTYV